MSKPHKHAALIHAWADGAKIQRRGPWGGWNDSEGYVSIQVGRRFVGAELKQSYFKQAALNLASALKETGDMFA